MRRTSGVVQAFAIAILAQGGSALAHTAADSFPFVLASQATAKRAAAPARPTTTAPSRASAPVVAVSSTGPGQSGYVHYFVITGPDGEPESHVGLELPDARIVWSFPESGVVIVPFMVSGAIVVKGKQYEIEHLYGIRPFPDGASMRALQRELPARVATWVGKKTPYCTEEEPSNAACVSCLGLVLRLLFPGATPDFPALPADFKSAQRNIFTTEDLLLYLAGVSIELRRDARLERIEQLALPDSLREQLVRLASVADAKPAPPPAADVSAPKPAAEKPRRSAVRPAARKKS